MTEEDFETIYEEAMECRRQSAITTAESSKDCKAKDGSTEIPSRQRHDHIRSNCNSLIVKIMF